MKILVTGGGGFIGQALVKRLIEDGHQVTSLSRKDYPELKKIGAKTITADLSDRSSLISAFAKHDFVFHVAAKAGFWGPYSEYFRSNVLGTLNVIDACRENNITRLVFTSSASVVFDGHDIEGGNENLPYPNQPLSYYTTTKAIAEKAVLNANGSTLKTISLRPHLVWGPGDNHILPRIIQQAKNGKLRILGDGENIIDSTYIDNCIEAHICALNSDENNPDIWGRPYFISNGEPVRLWDLLNQMLEANNIDPLEKNLSKYNALIIANLLEKKHKWSKKNTPPRLCKFLVHELTSSHWFDISAAKNMLGYNPQVSFKEGLKQLSKSPTEPFVENEKPIDKALEQEKIIAPGFLSKLSYLEGKKLTLKSIRLAWRYLRKTNAMIKEGAGKLGNEAVETKLMATVFFRMLENKLDLKNRKEPPTKEEVKEAINQLKDVGRFSLFATVSILPGGGFSLIGLELLARKFGISSFTLVPSSFRKTKKNTSKA